MVKNVKTVDLVWSTASRLVESSGEVLVPKVCPEDTFFVHFKILVDNFLLSQGKANNIMFCSIFVSPRLCQVWQRLVKVGKIVVVLIGSAKDSSFLLNITYYQKVSDMVESNALREDTHKKSVFLVVGPLRFYPPYTMPLFFFFFLVL